MSFKNCIYNLSSNCPRTSLNSRHLNINRFSKHPGHNIIKIGICHLSSDPMSSLNLQPYLKFRTKTLSLDIITKLPLININDKKHTVYQAQLINFIVVENKFYCHFFVCFIFYFYTIWILKFFIHKILIFSKIFCSWYALKSFYYLLVKYLVSNSISTNAINIKNSVLIQTKSCEELTGLWWNEYCVHTELCFIFWNILE